MLIEFEHSLFWVINGLRHGSCLNFDKDEDQLLSYEYYQNGVLKNRIDISKTDIVDTSTVMMDDKFTCTCVDERKKSVCRYKQGLLHGQQSYFYDEKCIKVKDYDMGKDKTKRDIEKIYSGDIITTEIVYWRNTKIPRRKIDHLSQTIIECDSNGNLSKQIIKEPDDSVLIRSYNSNGELSREERKVDNILQGPYTRYFNTRVVTGVYKNGKKHGDIITRKRDKDGMIGDIILRIQTYDQGVIQKDKNCRSDHKVIITFYENGLKNGVETTLNAEGEVINTRTWEQGQLVKR